MAVLNLVTFLQQRGYDEAFIRRLTLTSEGDLYIDFSVGPKTGE